MPTRIDNASGRKGLFAVCSYEASSEPRSFAHIAREEPLAYFSQGVYAMDAGNVERCMDLLAADFAGRDEIAYPALVPAPCPAASLMLVAAGDSGAREIRWAIIPGEKGLISTLNLAGMAFNDAWPSIVASACTRLRESEAQIDG